MAQYVFTMNGVGKVVPPKRQILRDIHLSFFPGAKIGVLGLNGSGKSTLLKIMAGLDTEIDGEARPQPGISIGYLPQEPQLDPDKDVRGNVEDGLGEIKAALTRLDEVYAAYADADADFDALAAEQAELENLLQATDGHNLDRTLEVAADALRLPPWDADVTKLSGGERRRTEIARALATDPSFILLDEPFAGVDPVAVEDIQRIVAQLTKKNIGILITDHNVQETLAITDRTYLMFEGSILKAGIPEELASDEMVRKVYLGQNFELRKKKIRD